MEKSETVIKGSLEDFEEINEDNLNAEEDCKIVENLMSDMLDKICKDTKDVKDEIVVFGSNEADKIFEEHVQVS